MSVGSLGLSGNSACVLQHLYYVGYFPRYMCLSVCAFVSVCVCRGSMRVWVCMGMKMGVSISMVVGAAMGTPGILTVWVWQAKKCLCAVAATWHVIPRVSVCICESVGVSGGSICLFVCVCVWVCVHAYVCGCEAVSMVVGAAACEPVSFYKKRVCSQLRMSIISFCTCTCRPYIIL